MVNQKAQAFDVFKLLIAAIIAIAILAVLLPLLIFPPITTTPSSEAQIAIKTIANKPATTYSSKNVVFGPQTETALNSRSIAQASNGLVSENQICISPGDFVADTVNWSNTGVNMAVMKYSGSSAKTVYLEAICDKGDFIFKGGANGSGPDDYFSNYDTKLVISGVDWTECGCIASGNNENCCLIAVKKV